jgi:hypothetical protein
VKNDSKQAKGNTVKDAESVDSSIKKYLWAHELKNLFYDWADLLFMNPRRQIVKPEIPYSEKAVKGTCCSTAEDHSFFVVVFYLGPAYPNLPPPTSADTATMAPSFPSL